MWLDFSYKSPLMLLLIWKKKRDWYVSQQLFCARFPSLSFFFTKLFSFYAFSYPVLLNLVFLSLYFPMGSFIVYVFLSRSSLFVVLHKFSLPISYPIMAFCTLGELLHVSFPPVFTLELFS